jgi:hypothetical protein
MGNLVNRDYEPVLAQAGDTVNIPIPPVLVANNIAEGGQVQTQNPNLGNAQIVLEHTRRSDFPDSGCDQGAGGSGLTAGLHATGGGGDRREHRDKPAEPVCRVYGEHAGGHAGDTAGGSGDRSGGERVFTAKVPPSEPKFLVVDAATYSALRQIERFSEFQTAGEAGLRA